MLYAFIVFIEIFVCIILQTAVFPMLSVAGIIPDTVIIVIIAAAYTKGRTAGLLTGLVSGLMLDLCSGTMVGMNGLIYMFIGYFAGYLNKLYSTSNYTIPLGVTALSEFVYSFIYCFCIFLMRGKIQIGYYMLRISLPRVIYTVVIAALLYTLFNLIYIWRHHLNRGEE